VNLVRLIALLMSPITPASSSKVYEMLGLEGPKVGELRDASLDFIKPGQKIRKPQPLFSKLPPDFLDRVEELLSNAREKASKKRPRIEKNLRIG